MCWESNKIKKECFCVVISDVTKELGFIAWDVSQNVLMPAVPPW